MKWFVSVSEFDPFGPIKFGKSRRATWLKYFIPIQVSGGLNWKLATWLVKSQVSMLYEPHNGKAMWKILEILYLEKELFWLHASLSNYYGNEWGPASDTVPRFSLNWSRLLPQFSEHLMHFSVCTVPGKLQLLCKDVHHCCQMKISCSTSRSLLQLWHSCSPPPGDVKFVPDVQYYVCAHAFCVSEIRLLGKLWAANRDLGFLSGLQAVAAC